MTEHVVNGITWRFRFGEYTHAGLVWSLSIARVGAPPVTGNVLAVLSAGQVVAEADRRASARLENGVNVAWQGAQYCTDRPTAGVTAPYTIHSARESIIATKCGLLRLSCSLQWPKRTRDT